MRNSERSLIHKNPPPESGPPVLRKVSPPPAAPHESVSLARIADALERIAKTLWEWS